VRISCAGSVLSCAATFGRSSLELILVQEPVRDLRLQIEKLSWWHLPGLRSFTYRVFIDGELVLEKYGY
jgi:hypothetical protein